MLIYKHNRCDIYRIRYSHVVKWKYVTSVRYDIIYLDKISYEPDFARNIWKIYNSNGEEINFLLIKQIRGTLVSPCKFIKLIPKTFFFVTFHFSSDQYHSIFRRFRFIANIEFVKGRIANSFLLLSQCEKVAII